MDFRTVRAMDGTMITSWFKKIADYEPWGDFNYVLDQVRQNGSYLQYASKQLQANREIVKIAVKQNGYALLYASEDLKNDREIVELAVKQYGGALEFSPTFQGDREIVKIAVKQYGLALAYAPTFQGDREIVKIAVKQNGFALEYAPTFQGDREIVKIAISKNGFALKYASDDLLKDREIVQMAVTKNAFSLQFADDTMKQDREIAKIAVAHDGLTLQFVHLSLQTDREIVKIAVKENAKVLKIVPWFHDDREIVKIAVAHDGSLMTYASEKLRNDREIVKLAVKQNGYALEFAHPDLKKDREIVKLAVAQNGMSLQFAHLSLRRDKEILKIAITEDKRAIQYIPDDLRQSPEFISKLFPRNTKPTHYTPNISIHGKVPKLKELISQLQEINQQPITDKQKYHNAVNKIKHKIKQLSGHNIETLEQLYELLEDKQYKFRTKTLDWDGGQKFTDNPEKVLAIYWDRGLYRSLGQDPILAKLLLHESQFIHFSDLNAPIGWALVYQKDKDTWIINQVQSDLFADFQNIKRKLETKTITLDHLFDQLHANNRSGYIEILQQPEFAFVLDGILRNPNAIYDFPEAITREDAQQHISELRTQALDLQQQGLVDVGKNHTLRDLNPQQLQYIEEKLGWLIKDWYNLVFHHVWQEARKASVTNLYWNTSKTVHKSLSEGARNVYYESVPRNLGFKKREVNFRDKPEELWYREARNTSWFKKIANRLDGEYWIIDGMSFGADGDIGPTNHDGYVMEHIFSMVFGDPDEMTDDDLWLRFVDNNLTPEENQLVEKSFPGYTTYPGLPKEYAVERLNWIRVLGNNFEANVIDESVLDEIVGHSREIIDIGDTEICIAECSTEVMLCFMLSELEDAVNAGQGIIKFRTRQRIGM